MSFTSASAWGKVILFGEHAVVYGRPAIAAPVSHVGVTVTVEAASQDVIIAQDIHQVILVWGASPDEPLSLTVRNTLAALDISTRPGLRLTVCSTIPIAAGLGSGAAVATAIVRALAAYFGRSLNPAEVAAIALETEKLFHGTPSGIDTTVIAFERPVYFRRGRPIETLQVRAPFWLAIGDTGQPALTKESVADVRRAWQHEAAKFDRIFDAVGEIVEQARCAIENGETTRLGPLMDQNQRWLREMDVSSPKLERLIAAARSAGAAGAKLCGGGRGGNMIALIAPEQGEQVRHALLSAGARNVIITRV